MEVVTQQNGTLEVVIPPRVNVKATHHLVVDQPKIQRQIH